MFTTINNNKCKKICTFDRFMFRSDITQRLRHSISFFLFYLFTFHKGVLFEYTTDWIRRIKRARERSMGFQFMCRFFCIFVMLANSAWSWELSNFHWVKSDKGDLVCGMSPPNKTLKDIGSRALCMSACCNVCPCPCQAVNYWTNARFCQHFYYIPCSYAVQEDCINYQVARALSSICSLHKLYIIFRLNLSLVPADDPNK